MTDIHQHQDINEIPPTVVDGAPADDSSDQTPAGSEAHSLGLEWCDPPPPTPRSAGAADSDPTSVVPGPDLPPERTADEPSEARLRANRANSLMSTGPKTAEGKQRSSRNSITHGAYVTRLASLLEGPFAEQPGESETFVNDIIAALEPHNALQQALAEQIASACLRQRRVGNWQHGLLTAAASETEAADIPSGDLEGRVAMRSLKLVEQEGRIRSQLGRELVQALAMFTKLKRAADGPDN